MTDHQLFTFISSGMGTADYRRRADGLRYRFELDDPTRTLNYYHEPAPADVADEWRRYRIADRAAFLDWAEPRIARGLDPVAVAEIVADSYPELEPVDA